MKILIAKKQKLKTPGALMSCTGQKPNLSHKQTNTPIKSKQSRKLSDKVYLICGCFDSIELS